MFGIMSETLGRVDPRKDIDAPSVITSRTNNDDLDQLTLDEVGKRSNCNVLRDIKETPRLEETKASSDKSDRVKDCGDKDSPK